MLSAHGFGVSVFMHSNSCFDIAARSSGRVFLIKVYSNIDSIRPEQAFELKKLANALNANALIVGERTKAFELKEGIVYERYDIPVVSSGTFGNFLDMQMSSAKYFKGRMIVKFDSGKLRERRKKLGMSQEELAKRLNTTPESIYRYETGHTGSLEVAQKLEAELGAHLMKNIDISENKVFDEKIFESRLSDEMLEKVRKLGLDIALFEHAPFDAYSFLERPLFISRGERKTEIAKKAMEIGKAGKALRGRSMILAGEFNKPMSGNVPVISRDDLTTLSRKKDLSELLEEKEGKNG